MGGLYDVPHLLHVIQLSTGFCASGQRTGLWLFGVPHSGQHTSYPSAYFSVISAIGRTLISLAVGAEVVIPAGNHPASVCFELPTVLAAHHDLCVYGGRRAHNGQSNLVSICIIKPRLVIKPFP
jgi:hypothetical protein